MMQRLVIHLAKCFGIGLFPYVSQQPWLLLCIEKVWPLSAAVTGITHGQKVSKPKDKEPRSQLLDNIVHVHVHNVG